MTEHSRKFSLVDLSLPARLVLATFLIATGIGYLSALVQLRVQHASDGQTMPGRKELERVFSGVSGESHLERLLTAPISEPFNGSGSMAGAFIDPARSSGWTKAARELQKANKKLTAEQADEKVRKQRNGERLAILDWLRNGADQKPFEDDSYPVTKELGEQLDIKGEEPSITDKFLGKDASGKPTVMIQSILQTRCVRCHREGASGSAGEYPLDTYAELSLYTAPEKSGGMSLPKLAQSTHVHMLGFAVLWCMTGLIFACTSFPAWMRAIFGPWTLIAQVADIACWWLAGQDVRFASAIMITGALVGLGLMVQLVGGCMDLFRKRGRLVMILVLLLVGIGVAGFYFKVVEPRLKNGHSVTSSLVERTSSG
jgi:hypothetical protein